eukprot:sb/3466177/
MRTNRVRDRPKEEDYLDAIQPSQLDVTFPETPLSEIERFYSNSTPVSCNLPLNLSVTPISPAPDNSVKVETGNLEMKRLAEERQRRIKERQASGGTPLSSKPVFKPAIIRDSVKDTTPVMSSKKSVQKVTPVIRSPSPTKPSFIPKFTPPPIQNRPPKTSSTVLPPTPPNTPHNKADGRGWDLPYEFSLYSTKHQLDNWFSPCLTQPISTSDLTPPIDGSVSSSEVEGDDSEGDKDLLTFLLKDVDDIITQGDYTHLNEISIQAQLLLDRMEGEGLVWDLLAGTEPIQNKMDTVKLVKELEDGGDSELAEELREEEGLEGDVKEELESCRADLLFFKLKNALECLDTRGLCV